jgi:hypothetical protein
VCHLVVCTLCLGVTCPGWLWEWGPWGVLGAPWSSAWSLLGPLGSHVGSILDKFCLQGGPFGGPLGLLEPPGSHQEHPGTPRGGPGGSEHHRPKPSTPGGPQEAPGAPQEAPGDPRRPPGGPRSPPGGPKELTGDPRMHPGGPRRPPGSPRRPPGGPRMPPGGPRSPKGATKSSKGPPAGSSQRNARSPSQTLTSHLACQLAY